MYGGSPDEQKPSKPIKDYHGIAETTIITFGELCYDPSCLHHLI